MLRFLSPLRVEHIDGRRWRVLDGFEYRLGSPEGDEVVRVEAGTMTDFASIPRLLWAVWPPTGGYTPAAVIHDLLYVLPYVQHRTQGAMRRIERGEADRIFLEAMAVQSVAWFTRRSLWLGVRLGGMAVWKKYRAAEHAANAAFGRREDEPQ